MTDYTNIFLWIGGVTTTVLMGISKYLFNKMEDHEKRIQKMEDIHGDRLDIHGDRLTQLEKKIDKLEISIQELAKNIHKEKNVENQLVQTMANTNKLILQMHEMILARQN